jgi:hypothetical protein
VRVRALNKRRAEVPRISAILVLSSFLVSPPLALAGTSSTPRSRGRSSRRSSRSSAGAASLAPWGTSFALRATLRSSSTCSTCGSPSDRRGSSRSSTASPSR